MPQIKFAFFNDSFAFLSQEQEVKGFREEISTTLNNIETRVVSSPDSGATMLVNNEWQNECRRVGEFSFEISWHCTGVMWEQKRFVVLNINRKNRATWYHSISNGPVHQKSTRSEENISFPTFSLLSCSVETLVEQLKFQSSDDINDVVKYISAINDKLNQVELLYENQHNCTEFVADKTFNVSFNSIYFILFLVTV